MARGDPRAGPSTDGWTGRPVRERHRRPGGLAFGKDGTLFTGTADGDILRVASDGTTSLLASTGDRLAA
jgi:glucose/arabinose dehydrogenase